MLEQKHLFIVYSELFGGFFNINCALNKVSYKLAAYGIRVAKSAFAYVHFKGLCNVVKYCA